LAAIAVAAAAAPSACSDVLLVVAVQWLLLGDRSGLGTIRGDDVPVVVDGGPSSDSLREGSLSAPCSRWALPGKTNGAAGAGAAAGVAMAREFFACFMGFQTILYICGLLLWRPKDQCCDGRVRFVAIVSYCTARRSNVDRGPRQRDNSVESLLGLVSLNDFMELAIPSCSQQKLRMTVS
jgi:hypothetical protein